MFGKSNYFLSDSGNSGAAPQNDDFEAYGPYGHAINPEAVTRRALPPWWPDDLKSAGSGASSTAAAASWRQQNRSLLPQPSSQQKQQGVQQSKQQQKFQQKHQQERQQQEKFLQQKMQQQVEQQRKQQQMEQKMRQQQQQQQQKLQKQQLLEQQKMEQQKRELQQQKKQIEEQQRQLRQQQEQMRKEQEERMQLELMTHRQLAYQQIQDYDIRQQFRCALCDLSFPSSAELQMHKQESSEHRSNHKMLICREECLRVYGVVTDHRLMQFLLHFCHTCCMAFENETQLSRHITSSVHLAATDLPSQATGSYASSATAAGTAAPVSAASTFHPPPRADWHSGIARANRFDMPVAEVGMDSAIGGSGSNNSLFGSRPDKERKTSTSGSKKPIGRRPKSSPPRAPPVPASSKDFKKKPVYKQKFKLKHAKMQPDSKSKASGNSLLGSNQAAAKKRPANGPAAFKPPPSKRSLDRPQAKFVAHCSLCNKHFNSETSSNEHFNGRKHAAAIASAVSKSDSAADDFVFCESCRMKVRRDQLVAHRASEKHTMELAKIGATMMKLVSR
ncbi:hypothetical protein BOX15_Mlig019820g4 [Macrostomum lignano]|uniref:C2H2-type domain-containing protein n=1 Tax=Macrostomum lignano TaxID=282301 RepID=A0A267DVS6_9PLAT|nr:hypothetical protein BOX15_Mlig019820g1 [Macrostomum lignano]PAA85066.1 hypothetical protein BOX15_Mlig019820g4 [Macrostomum lignano]